MALRFALLKSVRERVTHPRRELPRRFSMGRSVETVASTPLPLFYSFPLFMNIIRSIHWKNSRKFGIVVRDGGSSIRTDRVCIHERGEKRCTQIMHPCSPRPPSGADRPRRVTHSRAANPTGTLVGLRSAFYSSVPTTARVLRWPRRLRATSPTVRSRSRAPGASRPQRSTPWR